MKTITIKSKDFEIIISGQIEMHNCTIQQLGKYPITLEREDDSEMMIVKILDAPLVSVCDEPEAGVSVCYKCMHVNEKKWHDPCRLCRGGSAYYEQTER